MWIAYRRFQTRWSYQIRSLKLGRFITLSFIIIILFYVGYMYNVGFVPVLKDMSEYKASSLATVAINEGITEVLGKDHVTYENLVTFLKDKDENITGLITNIITVNRLKSELTLEINERINSIGKTNLAIPLGNVTGVEFLSGFGPNININMVPTGNTHVDFKNSFVDSGINQTKHEIVLSVKTNITILLPNKTKTKTEVVSSIPIAETIIVGRVPETITNVETKEEWIRDDILNLN